MQFQHGTFEKAASNGSLILTPFGVDGRQLVSDPCRSKNSLYTRYTQVELFKVPQNPHYPSGHLCLRVATNRKQKYEVLTDKYSNTQRLNLFAFDGAPLNPMYLAYKPPQMLPTQTLNPTGTSAAGAKSTGGAKAKRGLADDDDDELQIPLNRNAKPYTEPTNAARLWWIGAGMTALGGVGYFCF